MKIITKSNYGRSTSSKIEICIGQKILLSQFKLHLGFILIKNDLISVVIIFYGGTWQ